MSLFRLEAGLDDDCFLPLGVLSSSGSIGTSRSWSVFDDWLWMIDLLMRLGGFGRFLKMSPGPSDSLILSLVDDPLLSIDFHVMNL